MQQAKQYQEDIQEVAVREEVLAEAQEEALEGAQARQQQIITRSKMRLQVFSRKRDWYQEQITLHQRLMMEQLHKRRQKRYCTKIITIIRRIIPKRVQMRRLDRGECYGKKKECHRREAVTEL